jgi:hypothetical protein
MRLLTAFLIVWAAYYVLFQLALEYVDMLHPGALSLSGPVGYEITAPLWGLPLLFVAVKVIQWQKAKGRPAPVLTETAAATSLPSLSLYKGVDASYTVDAGRTIVTISSNSSLKSKMVYVGTGKMSFWWKPNTFQRGSSWACDVSMTDPAAVRALEEVAEDGRSKIEVALGNVFPAGFILGPGRTGALAAPAVHVEVQKGKDIWVFLLRPPWFPLRFELDSSVLSLVHETSRATAFLGVSADGSLSAQLTLDGTGFKKASLVVRRSFGSYSEDETIGEVAEGSRTFAWRPTTREFDFLLVTKGKISESELVQIASGLGANTSRSILGSGLKGGFVLCDMPAISYSLTLRGHRGFLEDSLDQTGAKLTWARTLVPPAQTPG